MQTQSVSGYDRVRYKALLFCSISVTLCSVVTTSLQIVFQPEKLFATLLSVVLTIPITFSPVVYHWRRSMGLAALCFCIPLAVGVWTMLFVMGGILGQLSPALITIPILFAYLLERRAAIVLLSTNVAMIIILGALNVMNMLDLSAVLTGQPALYSEIFILISLCVVTSFTSVTFVVYLRRAMEAAEDADRSKSSFLANMSHEIRTPLNGVLGMVQALRSQPLGPEQTEQVAILEDSAKNLTSLLNDILDLSKIEAGKLDIVPEVQSLRHVVGRTYSLFEPIAGSKGLAFELTMPDNLPEHFMLDPVRVRQCLSNLVSNAIKFTDTGRVSIQVNGEQKAGKAWLIAITVKDSGIGLDTAAQKKLFSAFSQADATTTRKYGGTGLGLSISRNLAQLMGGDISVTSAPGEGSAFTLSFSAEEADKAVFKPSSQSLISEKDMSALEGVRVLAVDDNMVNRQVIGMFLKPLGCNIIEAANGEEALQALRSNDFDIVLMDVHMPVMDGPSAVREIRSSKKNWSGIPILALTADAMSGDRERFLAMGMNEYVSKPIDRDMLIKRMSEILEISEPVTNAPATQAPKPEAEIAIPEPATKSLEPSDPLAALAAEWAEASVKQLQHVEIELRMPTPDTYETTYNVAHDISGQGTYFGMDFVADLAADLCEHLRTHKDDFSLDARKTAFRYVRALLYCFEKSVKGDGGESGARLREKLAA